LNALDKNPEVYGKLQERGSSLASELSEVFKRKSIGHQINQVGSMLSVHFCENPVRDFESAKKGDNEVFKQFFHHMLHSGIYLPPSAYESWFLCTTLTDEDQAKTVEAAKAFQPVNL
jgi:glutamate-1-semialdehyde 2,1-aminomutase